MLSQSPLRYPGGKTFLSKEFKRILDALGLNKPVYIEPFAGGAGAALALLFDERVERIVINDFDKAIFSFWKAVTKDAHRFAKKILTTPVSVEEWKKQKKVYSEGAANEFDLGFATFFLNRTNRSGVMNAGPIGGMDQGGNYKIDARYNKKALADRILKIGSYADRIDVRNEEGIKLTKEYLFRANTFIYLDPPYFKQGAMLYHSHYQEDDHVKLAKLLNSNTKKHWLLTYDERAKIRRLYEERARKRLPFNYRVRGSSRKARELMIFSDTTCV